MMPVRRFTTCTCTCSVAHHWDRSVEPGWTERGRGWERGDLARKAGSRPEAGDAGSRHGATRRGALPALGGEERGDRKAPSPDAAGRSHAAAAAGAATTGGDR